jgi:hypothetical protein
MQSTGGLSHLAHRKRKVLISQTHIGRASSIDGACSDKAIIMASALSSQ